MRRVMVAFTTLLFLTSCATGSRVAYIPTAEYERPEWLDSEAKGRIEGSAFRRTRGGEVRTCAGGEIYAVPVSDYASERMNFIYGNLSGGAARNDIGIPPTEKYKKDWFTAFCDVSGNFVFENVPVGEYFLVASIVWEYQGRYLMLPTGGPVMRVVSVTENNTSKSIVTD